ncbi:ABC transporter permease [Vibrio sonorensis]|uniref:ABC transporter permease n=1 Tax=Vibrio sonorensis TaxID=1004316 RepID=UPI0008DA55B4|nr:ABC transporter permease [Vibrio sonorensis]
MGKLIPQSVKIAFLNLSRNGRRSALSIAIVAIAVFALTSAGGFGLYTYQSLEESTARDVGHLTLHKHGYFEQDEEMPLSNGLADAEQIVRKLISLKEVRGVQPKIEFNGLISNGSKSTIFMGKGVNDREFDMKGPFLDVREGKTLSSTSSTRYNPDEPEVMLAKDLAKNLNVTIGDWITILATTSEGALNALDFKVRGIYSTGMPELDKRELYLHIDSAKEMLVSDKVSTLSVFLLDTDQTESMTAKVRSLLEQMGLAEVVEVTPWQERAFYYEKVKDLYNRIFGILGLVMGLVVFVSLFNTLTMSVTERTREIGTLSALGTYPNEIIAGFVRESSLMALIGAVIGGVLTALTSVALMVFDVQMPPPPGSTEGYPLNIYFSPELFMYTTFGVVLICLLAGWFSARKGVNKPITEALIYV